MIIHLVKKDRSIDCVCGAKLPKNTTLKKELVTCSKCKKWLRALQNVLKFKSKEILG